MLLNFEHLKTFYSALKQKMKNFRGNWNQNDPTADDYIKNRPFYSEGALVEIVSNLTSEDYNNGNHPKCNFIPDNKYKVIWNGKVYDNLICYEFQGCNVIGGNGYPFYIDDDGGYNLYIDYNEGNGNFVVSIYLDETVIHKLDEKYLPDNNFATIDELSAVATSGSYHDLLDAPASVRYDASQWMTSAQKSIARNNIGAGTSNFSGSYNDLTDKTHYHKVKNFILPYRATLYQGQIATPGVKEVIFSNRHNDRVVAEGTVEAVKDGSIHYVNINGIEYMYRGEATFILTSGKTTAHDDTTCTGQMRVFGNASLITKYLDNLNGFYDGGIIGYEQFKDTGEDFCYILGVFDHYPVDVNLAKDALCRVTINDTSSDKNLSTNDRAYVFYDYVTLDDKYIPDTIARKSDIPENISWNDLTNKPFEDALETITWDGDTTGKETMSGNYKISDTYIQPDKFIGATIHFANGYTYTVVEEDITTFDDQFGTGFDIRGMVAGNETSPSNPDLVGIFVVETLRSIEFPVKTLDDKFIPDTIARMSDIQTMIGDAIGGSY